MDMPVLISESLSPFVLYWLILGLSFWISHNFRSSCHIFSPLLKKKKSIFQNSAVHTRKPRAALELCDNGALLWCVVISVTRRPVILDSKENNVRYFILRFHFTSMCQSDILVLDLWLTSWWYCKNERNWTKQSARTYPFLIFWNWVRRSGGV